MKTSHLGTALKKSQGFFWTAFIVKKVVLVGLLLCSVKTFADDTVILDKIEQAGTAAKTLSTTFRQMKVVAATGSKTQLNGTLYFVAPDKMAQHYNSADEALVINGKQFYMMRNGKKMLFDTDKNLPMRNLRNTLLYCLQGTVRTLAKENDADLTVAEDAKGYTVTLTARKKAVRGYKTIVLRYSKNNYLLTTMEMNEFSGNSNIYTMDDYTINAQIEAAKFNIPK
ncbi:MAG: outer membrane lipoprotein carrier protein LolA [Paludibacteraceae bacterium]